MTPEEEERRRRTREAAEDGEWSDYQRLVLSELERHGSILGNLPETLEILREEVRDQRHSLDNVRAVVQGYDFPKMFTTMHDHEKRLARVEVKADETVAKADLVAIRDDIKALAKASEIEDIKKDVKGLNFRYYAVIAGLISALAILVGVIVKLSGL